jgi:hypothetical protein
MLKTLLFYFLQRSLMGQGRQFFTKLGRLGWPIQAFPQADLVDSADCAIKGVLWSKMASIKRISWQLCYG